MNPIETIFRGIRQALLARKLIVLLWLLNLAAALPAALLVADGLGDSFGASLVAGRMQQGFDMDWYAEHEARASGLMATFRPTLAGPGVVLENLDAWLTGRLFRSQGEVRMPGVGQPRSSGNGLEFPGLLIFGVAYALLWALVLGGVLDRLARPGEKLACERFGAAAGRYFVRFVGLASISAVLYLLVYRLGRWLYGTIEDVTRDVTEERIVLGWLVLAAALVAALLHLVRMVFDYAKIAAVVEDRGLVSSLGVGLGTVLRYPLRCTATYAGFGALALAALALYALAAPGAGPGSWPGIALAFLLSQLYLMLRLFLRVGLLAGQMDLYRASRP